MRNTLAVLIVGGLACHLPASATSPCPDQGCLMAPRAVATESSTSAPAQSPDTIPPQVTCTQTPGSHTVLVGQVLSDSGEPLPHAQVEDAVAGFRTVVDSQGHFRATSLHAGEHLFTVSDSTHLLVQHRIVVPPEALCSLSVRLYRSPTPAGP